MWKNVENEEMEKYGMVIINEKTKIEKSIRFHPIFMAEIPVFSNMAIGLFCPVLFVMFPGRNLHGWEFSHSPSWISAATDALQQSAQRFPVRHSALDKFHTRQGG